MEMIQLVGFVVGKKPSGKDLIDVLIANKT